MAFADIAALRLPEDGTPPRMNGFDDEAAPEEFDFDTGEEGLPAQSDRPFAYLFDWIDSDNIADQFDDERLADIGQTVIREFDLDEESRSEWIEQNEQAFKLAMQVAEKKTSPWPGASNVIFPLMTVAAVQFAARAYPAIVSGQEVVKGAVLGDDNGQPQIGQDGTPVVQMDQQGQPQPVWQVEPGAKRERADNIGSHMSYQLLFEMEDWEEDTDKLLHIVPIAGCCFRKTYFDPSIGQNVSELASAENVVINYWAKSMGRAPRISERIWRYPNEIEEMQRLGIWQDEDFARAVETTDDDGKNVTDPTDTDAPREFIEQHRRLDLDDDGYAEPYIVTVHCASGKVARIVPRFDADGVKIKDDQIVRIEAIEYYTKYDFLPNPEGGIYGIGFGKLLSPLNHSVNTVINQLIDAGTLANTPSGFIGRGLSMHSGSVRFKIGEFKPINAPGSRIRDAIVPLQFKEPSTVLFQLLGLLIEAAKEVASIKDVMTGETVGANMSPTTMMGLIDQGEKVFSGIYKRVHRACRKEFHKLYRLNRVYLENRVGFAAKGKWVEVSREDYADDIGVQPVSDPTQVSNMQKMARAELLRSYNGDPLVDQLEIRRRTLDAAGIDPDDLLVEEQQGPTPEMMEAQAEAEHKARELEIEASKSRSEEVKNYAQAVKALADADKASTDSDVAWTHEQMEILRSRMEMLNGVSANQQRPAQSPQGPMGGQGQQVPPDIDASMAMLNAQPRPQPGA